jgi:DNA-binding HxlR family transcriptional regulator
MEKVAADGSPQECPLEECLQLLAGAWTPKVLWYLREGPRRFGVLRRLLVGVSAKVLTTRLRELEERGLVARAVQPTSPPSVEYSLTPLGHEIQPVLGAIADVGRKLQRKRARVPTPKRASASAVSAAAARR